MASRRRAPQDKDEPNASRISANKRAVQLSGSFAPDLVIPFKLDHKAAVDAPQNHYRGKVLLPKSFREGNHVEEVQGVYVPFWLYDATAEGDAHYDAEKRRTHWEDDDEVVETDHYDVDRSGYMSFARVPVDGSSKMPDGHMDAIEPFDYGELVPFSVAYMPGYLANRWDEDATACRERAEGRIRQSVDDVLRGTVTARVDDQGAHGHRVHGLGDGEAGELAFVSLDVADEGEERPSEEERRVDEGDEVPDAPERFHGGRRAEREERRRHKVEGSFFLTASAAPQANAAAFAHRRHDQPAPRVTGAR